MQEPNQERNPPMYEFKVQGMTCGHCTQTITKAVLRADPHAKVAADIKSQTVRVESAHDRSELARLIDEAGYAVHSISSL